MEDTAYLEGNDFYRNGDLESAEKSYFLAQKLNTLEPKYASNLSAVYYEQGRYILSIETIMNSWRVLRAQNSVDGQPTTPSTTNALAIKLVQRFLKAKMNSIAGGLLSLHDKKKKKGKGKTTENNAGIEQDIQSFCETVLKESPSQHKELQQVWDMWLQIKADCGQHTAQECTKKIAEAGKRLRDLPIYKGSLHDLVELFRFGHDVPQSLFRAPEVNHVADESLLIDCITLNEQRWRKVSLLFGGSGDGRHVFATLADYAHDWYFVVGHPRFEGLRMPDLHMTMLDVHPATVARLMLSFALIRKSMAERNPALQLEIEATAFYFFSSAFIPDYCAKMVCAISKEVIEELTGKTPVKLTKYWSVDEQTKPRVLTILEYWSTPLQKSSKIFFDLHTPVPPPPGRATFLKRAARERLEGFKEDIIAFRKKPRGAIVTPKDPQLPLYNNWDGEDLLFHDARVLLPPKQFLSRHPALKEYVKSGGKTGKEELQKEVIGEWKPNPMAFDNRTTESDHFSRASGGYPRLTFEDPSRTASLILDMIMRVRGRLTVDPDMVFDQTYFVIFQQFMDSTRRCLIMADNNDNDVALTLEFVCTELNSGLSKLITGDFGPRPESFPKKFLRMWLSNVPDYTGGVLGNTVYLSPYLEDTQFALMSWNCLKNQGSFSSLKDFCFNYSYLTAPDIQRFFSCLVRNEDEKPHEIFNMSVIPRTKLFSSLVSKKELHGYLSWILLRILCPPIPGEDPNYRVDDTINLVTFIRLIVAFCTNFGCPGHWLAEYMQNMANDRLFTTATVYNYYLPVKKLPTPTSTERKLNLEHHQLEIETILVAIQRALPFSFAYPKSYAPSVDSIMLVTTKIRDVVIPQINVCWGDAWLMFFKTDSLVPFLWETLPIIFPGILDNPGQLGPGTKIQIVTAIDAMDLSRLKQVVSWRMSERWYKKMMEEGWSMFVWVTSLRRNVTVAVHASEWDEPITI